MSKQSSTNSTMNNNPKNNSKSTPNNPPTTNTPSVFLQSRAKQFEYLKELGRTQIVTAQSTLAQRGGFYCETCDILLKDSRSFTIHQNGRKHQKMIGKGMFARRVKHPEIEVKLKGLRQKYISLNPHVIQWEEDDNDDGDVGFGSNGTKGGNNEDNGQGNMIPVYITVLHRLLQAQYDIDDMMANDDDGDEVDRDNDDDNDGNNKRSRNNNEIDIDSDHNINLIDHLKDDNDVDGLGGDDDNDDLGKKMPKFRNYDIWWDANNYFSIPNKPKLIIPPINRYGDDVIGGFDDDFDDFDPWGDNNNVDLGENVDQNMPIQHGMDDFDDNFDPWADNTQKYKDSMAMDVANKLSKASNKHNNIKNNIANNTMNRSDDDFHVDGSYGNEDMLYKDSLVNITGDVSKSDENVARNDALLSNNTRNYDENNTLTNDKGRFGEATVHLNDNNGKERTDGVNNNNNLNHNNNGQDQVNGVNNNNSNKGVQIGYHQIVFEDDDGADWTEDDDNNEADLMYDSAQYEEYMRQIKEKSQQ